MSGCVTLGTLLLFSGPVSPSVTWQGLSLGHWCGDKDRIKWDTRMLWRIGQPTPSKVSLVFHKEEDVTGSAQSGGIGRAWDLSQASIVSKFSSYSQHLL